MELWMQVRKRANLIYIPLFKGNKREGRRGSYGAYPEMAMAGLHPSQMSQMQPSQISPMSLVTGPRFNGNGTSHHGSPMPPSKSTIICI